MSETTQTKIREAEDVLERARAAHQAELDRLSKARQNVAALEEKIGESDPSDTRGLTKLQGEIVGHQIAANVLERTRVPRTAAAVAEAERVLADAQREHDAVEAAAGFEEVRANRARLEAEIDELAKTTAAKARRLVTEHLAAVDRGWGAARDAGEEWPHTPHFWPKSIPCVADLFAFLAVLATPPPVQSPASLAIEERRRQRERKQEDRQIARALGRDPTDDERRGVADTGFAALPSR